ncbi:hypothetical protein BCR32DRAFT_287874 [Anaeromyces robustus]|uniref:PPPDE domain-containing protein n=1 Tax=Anaeromyces robustus TaxID=1754192 RepID=A0A1Y1VPQ1_9FUNG|nr:hypothetical protein BCR32DRAFT_287874 [Anaeromyces robustus]|eukprot:ORX63292.1 hypothetical protein BCR32DRAFT_287874 [Anaeromyces robustus]
MRLKIIYIYIFLQVVLTLIHVPGSQATITANKLEKRDKQKYFFAIGFRRLEYYDDIKNERWDKYLSKILTDNFFLKIGLSNEDRIKYGKAIFENLKNNKDLEKLEDIMNLRHVGFYLGTKDYGTIFEFQGEKWIESGHKLVIDKNENLVKPSNPNDWDWKTLNKTGYTYKSPEALSKTLERNYKQYNYFKYGSYHLLCNNCQDFAYWCLKIIRDENLFVPGYEINYVKDFFTILPPNANRDYVKTLAGNVIDNIIDSCFITTMKKADHEYYMHFIFNQLLKKDVGGILTWEDDECSVKDFKKYLSKGYSVCSVYSYYGYIYSNNLQNKNNSDTISIASDNNENNEMEYDIGKDFGEINEEDTEEICYNFNNSNSSISDNNLNSSGSESIKHFSFKYTFSAIMLFITWWIYTIF